MLGCDEMNNYGYNRQMMMNNNNLSGLYTGFIRGNMFPDLYSQYKNYQPQMLNPRNEQEQYLLDLDQAQFAMHDIHLYLDNYPNDTNMIQNFNKNRELYNNILKEYENKYGPICITSDSLNRTPWQWNNEPWPWEGSGL